MRRLVIILIISINYHLNGQNLIQNSSFEEANPICGYVRTAENFNATVNFWTTPSRARPEIYSTDLDEGCLNYYSVNVGMAPKDGKNAVSVCALTTESNYRSYVQVSLLDKLKKGKTYYLDFWMSPLSWSKNASSHIGAYFSEVQLVDKGMHRLTYIPNFVHTQVISDTLNWTHIRGKFKANNKAEYMIIGNFHEIENVKVEVLRKEVDWDNSAAVYLIDDLYLGEKPRKLKNDNQIE